MLFRTQECNKTKREIQFNVSKHCPAAANILLTIYKYAETECNGYLTPVWSPIRAPAPEQKMLPRVAEHCRRPAGGTEERCVAPCAQRRTQLAP